MKTRSTIFTKAILCVLMAALTLVICFPAAAATSTMLTTTVPETLPLLLELSGNGTTTINGVAYSQSETIEIPRHATIVLQITPSVGNKIRSVVYNGIDYTKDVKEGTLTLPAITESVTLGVSFAEIASSPQTGDSNCPFLWMLLMLISLVGIVVILLVKKECIAKPID